MTKPDWLPDWRDEKAYPKPEKLDREQWAWQFLRRNPDYQSDHARWRELAKHTVYRELPGGDGFEDFPEPEEDMRFWVCDPPAKEGETYDDYVKRIGGGYRMMPTWLHLANNYGMSIGFPDPAIERPSLLAFELIGLSLLTGMPGRKIRTARQELGDYDIWVRFNLEWPIDFQIEKARKHLKVKQNVYKRKYGLQPKRFRNRYDKYQIYLRVLDGEVTGAKLRAMADVLYPELDNVYPEYRRRRQIRNDLNAAKKLRDRDYALICLSPPEKVPGSVK